MNEDENYEMVVSKGRRDKDGKFTQTVFMICVQCKHWIGMGGKPCLCSCHRPSMYQTERELNGE